MKVLNDGTCLVAASAVVGQAKIIVEESKGDFKWITSPSAGGFNETHGDGSFHPKEVAKFLKQQVTALHTATVEASGTVRLPDNKEFYMAVVHASITISEPEQGEGLLDQINILIFDHDMLLLSIMTDADYVRLFKDIIVA